MFPNDVKKCNTTSFQVGRDEYMLMVFGTTFFANLAFFGLGSVYAWFDYSNIPWIKKYKIQPDMNEPTPDRAKFIKLIKQVVFNQTVVLVPYMVVIYHLTQWRKQFGPLFGQATTLDVLPEFHWVILEFGCFLIIEEIGFFYSHKLAHHKKVSHFKTTTQTVSIESILGVQVHPQATPRMDGPCWIHGRLCSSDRAYRVQHASGDAGSAHLRQPYCNELVVDGDGDC